MQAVQERERQELAVQRVLAAPDHFQVLELPRSAKTVDINKAYRHLSKALHPDKNGAQEADKAFVRLNEARNTLSDPSSRETYERKLNASVHADRRSHQARAQQVVWGPRGI